MSEKKLSLNSTASEILNKVTNALSLNKNSSPQEEDVLELLEEVPHEPAPELTVQTPVYITSNSNNTKETLAQPTAQNELIKQSVNSQHIKNQPLTQNTEEGKPMKEKLVSETTAEATSSLLKKLKQSATNKPVSDGLKFDSGTTVEEMVAELIKPYLSNWLDQHLPAIVKNVVEREVKKLMPTED